MLGGMAFRSSSGNSTLARSREGKGPETPVMIFERHLREVGLGSKVWRVREQVRWEKMCNSFAFPPFKSDLSVWVGLVLVLFSFLSRKKQQRHCFIYLLSASLVDSHPRSYSSDTSPLSYSALPTAACGSPRGHRWNRA